ncbi:hypothetical protein AeMF1_018921 [Aphanomyces euteiches]|nr:hypothetical protein AeMF1_018921 [Aphanomyces euteiches]
MRASVLGLVLAAVVFLSGETTAHLRSAEDSGINLPDSGINLPGTSSLQHHRGNEHSMELWQPEARAHSGSRFKASRQFSFKKAFRKVKHALQSKAAGIVTKAYERLRTLRSGREMSSSTPVACARLPASLVDAVLVAAAPATAAEGLASVLADDVRDIKIRVASKQWQLSHCDFVHLRQQLPTVSARDSVSMVGVNLRLLSPFDSVDNLIEKN